LLPLQETQWRKYCKLGEFDLGAAQLHCADDNRDDGLSHNQHHRHEKGQRDHRDRTEEEPVLLQVLLRLPERPLCQHCAASHIALLEHFHRQSSKVKTRSE
jgi:hypothetical protein